MSKIALLIGSAVVALIAATTAHATLTFSGTIARDDQVQLFSFDMLAAGTATIETFSYAGGTDAAGHLVPRGGFDPIVSVFDRVTGALIALVDDGASRVDPATGAAFDSFMTPALGPGLYWAAISQFDNFPIGPNLANGFLESGATFTSAFGCSNGRFCDVSGVSPGNNRNGNFDLGISGPQVVPEPGTLALIGLAIPGIFLAKRRRSEHTGTDAGASTSALIAC